MEFSHIGKTCEVSTCKQLDFLPFTCDSCHKTFCIDHRKYTDHDCTEGLQKNKILPTCPLCEQVITVRDGENPNIKVDDHINKGCPKNPTFGKKCTIRNCKTIGMVPIFCRECRLHFCLAHRQPSDHKCKIWTQKQERQLSKSNQPTQSKTVLSTIIGDLQNCFVTDTSNVTQMKSKAIGDSRIDDSKRFYLDVIFPQDSGVSPKMMFFNSAWSVGKTLDVIANVGSIVNNNNIPGAPKLRLYSLKTREALPSMKSLAELADVLRSGDSILLEKETTAHPASLPSLNSRSSPIVVA